MWGGVGVLCVGVVKGARVRGNRSENGGARARPLARVREAESAAVGGAGARLRGPTWLGGGAPGRGRAAGEAGGGASPDAGAEGGRNSCSLSTF